MKNKLCVIDLASIIESVSGCDPIESPTDQKLLLGMKDAIDRYRADGWHLAIVSNQDGCDIHAVKATQVRVSDYVDHGDDRYRVVETKSLGDGVVFVYDRERPNGKDYSFYYPGSELLIHRKTIESAIEEVTFAADLCGINEAYFCPDIAGKVCINIEKTTERRWEFPETTQPEWKWGTIPNANPFDCDYRLHSPGMLEIAEFYMFDRNNQHAIQDRLMIGASNSIQAASKAGFKFMSAEEFRSLNS